MDLVRQRYKRPRGHCVELLHHFRLPAAGGMPPGPCEMYYFVSEGPGMLAGIGRGEMLSIFGMRT